MKIQVKKFSPITEGEYTCRIHGYKLRNTDGGEITGISFRLVVLSASDGSQDFKGRTAYYNTDIGGETNKLYNLVKAVYPDASEDAFDLYTLIEKQIVVSMKQGHDESYPHILSVRSVEDVERI